MMLSRVSNLDFSERLRIGGLFGVVALMHLVGWGVLFLVAPDNPTLLGTGVLAYSLGLRHAFDADHIVAIDNTTRAALQDGRRHVGVGFFFSLGHSTVVAAMALALAVATDTARTALPSLETVGGFIGTLVSGSFLYATGLLNLLVLVDLFRVFLRMRDGDHDPEGLEAKFRKRGFVNRFAGRYFDAVRRSWHVYPLGVLFGLGFDTASEVALLAIAAGAASDGLSPTAIAVLPLLFAAGMSLLDTADGAFMLYAYDWAFSTPLRKIYYNLTVTGVSVAVALFIGTVELLQVLASGLDLRGGLWTAARSIDTGNVGYAIVALFVFAWLASYLFWRIGNIEERWSAESS
ncbi:HoxN/HupN/NixA family nickel/cobalt transporter [Haladaptatus sp. R4]|uniref:HoxN/HupN/NixA family nickel/cobalt transporter n=1 Tax=Haladaptatus sp. R4 TaxID=1679489 RepID=UPI001CBE7F25|nr:HoxN/HupN/NixA family nickel/cobalt transporter [Haladaptatus sp. R4]